MSVLRSRLPCLLLAVLGWLALPAHAADDADTDRSGGTFTTPTYPPRTDNANAPGGAAGQGSGATAPNGTGAVPPGPSGTVIVNPRTGRPATQPDGTVLRRDQGPPPKPTEFQKFVQGATGRLLPMFGASFFRDAIDTLNPIDSVPVAGDYTVGPGDEVIIRAWGSIDVDYRTTVDRNGMLNLP